MLSCVLCGSAPRVAGLQFGGVALATRVPTRLGISIAQSEVGGMWLPAEQECHQYHQLHFFQMQEERSRRRVDDSASQGRDSSHSRERSIALSVAGLREHFFQRKIFRLPISPSGRSRAMSQVRSRSACNLNASGAPTGPVVRLHSQAHLRTCSPPDSCKATHLFRDERRALCTSPPSF